MVAGASVKATNTGTDIVQTTTTTSDGQYTFQDLPLGTYSIAVNASGFPTVTVDKVEVTAGSAYTLPIKLSIEKQTTTVEVSAAALTLATTTATQDYILTTEAVQDVPMDGRDFTQVAAVQPGYGGYSVRGFRSFKGTLHNQTCLQVDG